MDGVNIELTADGSHTLFIPALDEHYHSKNGAIQESNHVYIETGLQYCRKSYVTIFEIGFGTGLNAYLTLEDTINTDKKIQYLSIEANPLPCKVVEKLNYPNQLNAVDADLFVKLHEAAWNKTVKITQDFSLTKIEADLTQFDFNFISGIDLVYFDAFAPDKQSEMWSQEIFDYLYSLMNDEAILVTYCAKGEVRRRMQHSGFMVERLPGPPGKREMLRAIKQSGNVQ